VAALALLRFFQPGIKCEFFWGGVQVLGVALGINIMSAASPEAAANVFKDDVDMAAPPTRLHTPEPH